ncbi:MAG: hypothetical protein ACOX45_08850 [Acutalibacteraceae bacterium]
MYQFINGQLTATQLKDVEYIDLLGREPINVDLNPVFMSLTDKTVLITGGGRFNRQRALQADSSK